MTVVKFALALLVLASASVIALSAPRAAPPCRHTRFDTELIKKACADGGQPAAKAAMKQFTKDHHITTCNHCHSSLAPRYELKRDALDEFRGGT